MAKQVKRRRGTAADHSTFIGAIGEITYVTDEKTLRLHDGVTMGGIPVGGGSGAWEDITGKPDTLAGFGITDAYSIPQIDALLGSKADKTNTYTITQVDGLLAVKASSSDLALTDAKADAALTAIDGLAVENVIPISGDYTVTMANNGNLLSVDATSPVIITLPEISTVGEPFSVKIKKIDSSFNAVTIVASGSDLLNDGTDNLTITSVGSGLALYSDVDVTPNNWTSFTFGMKIGDATPIGTEAFYSGKTAPLGWLVEDGREISRVLYADLYNHALSSGMIVTETDWQAYGENRSKFSTGDGSTTFRLPDLLTDGLFLRSQSGLDVNFGRRQEDQLRSHAHEISFINGVGTYSGPPMPMTSTTGGRDSTYGTFGQAGTETRPKNAGRLPIIKAFTANITEGSLATYTKVQIDGLLGMKADRATTLAGYGILDGVTASDLAATTAKADAALAAVQDLAAETVVTIQENYVLSASDANKVFAVNAISPIIITLPSIAAVGEPFTVKVKKIDSSVNTVTIVPSGGDTIDGVAGNKVIDSPNLGYTLYSDVDPSPDNWTTFQFGVMVGDSTPIGAEMFFSATNPPPGWLVENGSLLSRATYPDLWSFAQSSGNIVSETEWQTIPTNRVKFSTGNGSTTFRVPSRLISGSSTVEFESQELVIPTTYSTQDILHGLGVKPNLAQVILVCKTADRGFQVGDEMVIHHSYANASTQSTMINTVSTASKITLQIRNLGNFIYTAFGDLGDTKLNITKWKIKIRAWAFNSGTSSTQLPIIKAFSIPTNQSDVDVSSLMAQISSLEQAVANMGSGGLTATVTLADSVTVGDFVAAVTSGNVEKVKQVIANTSASLPFEFSSTAANIKCAYDGNNGKLVIAYRGTSGHGYAIVGTVTDTSITFGSPVAFVASSTVVHSIVYCSTPDRFVITFSYSPSGFGSAIVGAVSGNSISFGTINTYQNSNVYESTSVYDSVNNKVVILYANVSNSSFGTAIVGTFSGSALSYGATVAFENSNTAYFSAIYHPTGGKIVVAYRDSSLNGKCIVGNISGTVMVFGTSSTFASNLTRPIAIAYDPFNTKAIISYSTNTSGFSLVGTVSGNSITYGGATSWLTGVSNLFGASYEVTTQQTIIHWYGSGSIGKATYLKTSGTSIIVGDTITFSPYSSESTSAYIPAVGKTVICYLSANSSGNAVILSSGSTYTNYTDVCGVAVESKSTGQSCKIVPLGGIAPLSGLLTGSDYYLGETGGITTSTTSVYIGRALSPSQLLLRGLTKR